MLKVEALAEGITSHTIELMTTLIYVLDQTSFWSDRRNSAPTLKISKHRRYKWRALIWSKYSCFFWFVFLYFALFAQWKRDAEATSFRGNGSYGKFTTYIERIKTLGIISRLSCYKIIIVTIWVFGPWADALIAIKQTEISWGALCCVFSSRFFLHTFI